MFHFKVDCRKFTRGRIQKLLLFITSFSFIPEPQICLPHHQHYHFINAMLPKPLIISLPPTDSLDLLLVTGQTVSISKAETVYLTRIFQAVPSPVLCKNVTIKNKQIYLPKHQGMILRESGSHKRIQLYTVPIGNSIYVKWQFCLHLKVMLQFLFSENLILERFSKIFFQIPILILSPLSQIQPPSPSNINKEQTQSQPPSCSIIHFFVQKKNKNETEGEILTNLKTFSPQLSAMKSAPQPSIMKKWETPSYQKK